MKKEIIVELTPDAKSTHVDALGRMAKVTKVDHDGDCICVRCECDEDQIEEIENLGFVQSVQVKGNVEEIQEEMKAAKEAEDANKNDDEIAHDAVEAETERNDGPKVPLEGVDAAAEVEEPPTTGPGTVIDEFGRTRPDTDGDQVPDDNKPNPVVDQYGDIKPADKE